MSDWVADELSYFTGVLNSALNLRTDDKHLMFLVQSKQEYCNNRIQKLLSKINEADADTPSSKRNVMGELHIDNQTRREAASSDYTPLHNAIRRAPLNDVSTSHRLSRTDSQMSGSSTSSSTTHTISARSINSPRTLSESSEPTAGHTIPPQLQRSISHLQQKQLRKQQQQLQQSDNTQQYQPGELQPSVYSRAAYPDNTDRAKPAAYLSSNKPVAASVPTSQTLYREVSIPTTLQRNDYIRDGCRAGAGGLMRDKRPCASPSPSVIPPPKEFQEPVFTKTPATVPSITPHNYPPQPLPRQSYNREVPQYSHRFTGNAAPLPTPPQNQGYSMSSNSQENYRESHVTLPPKQNINKQNIRELLVQDMIMRKGTTNAPVEPPRTKPQYQPQAYAPQFEEPLWTPPKHSAYEQGLSHYDRPNYQRQDLYGQVHTSKPTVSSRYPSNSSSGLQHRSLVRYFTCHTYLA